MKQPRTKRFSEKNKLLGPEILHAELRTSPAAPADPMNREWIGGDSVDLLEKKEAVYSIQYT